MHFTLPKQLASEDGLFAFIYIQFARNVEKPRKGEMVNSWILLLPPLEIKMSILQGNKQCLSH